MAQTCILDRLESSRRKLQDELSCLELRVQVFMLSVDGELDSPTLQAILDSGHSRIPIHRGADRWDCCSQQLKIPWQIMVHL